MRFSTCLVVLAGACIVLSYIPSCESATVSWSYRVGDQTACSMSENGNYVATGSYDGQLLVFDKYGNIHGKKEFLQKINTLSIADNGLVMVGTSTIYETLTLMGTGERITLYQTIISISGSNDGKVSVIGTNNYIYYLSSTKIQSRFYTNRPVFKTAISSDGNSIIGASSRSVYLYSKPTDRWYSFDTTYDISSLAISGDGSVAVYGDIGGNISIYRNNEFSDSMQISRRKVMDCQLSEDGDFLFCADMDMAYYIKGTRVLWTIEPESSIHSLAMSSHGELMAIALQNRILIVNNQGQVLQTMSYFLRNIQDITMSKDGQFLSCHSQDVVSFFKLYDHVRNFTDEFPYSSVSPSIPGNKPSERWSRVAGKFSSVHVGDINGDGMNEIVCRGEDSFIVLDEYRNHLWEKSFEEELQGLELLDVTGDLIPEIIVSLGDGRMKLEFYDGSGGFLSEYEFYSLWSTFPCQDTSIFPLMALDIDSDGSIEVISIVAAMYCLNPRGILVFEYPSFGIDWYYPTAPVLVTVSLTDLNNDGDLEIVSGSFASCNGRKVGNTDDCHACVFAVNLQGEELWTRDVGPGFKKIYIDTADLDDDGSNEVVCVGASALDNWGELFILDSQGGYVKRTSFNHAVFLQGVSDLGYESGKEILVSDSKGFLSLYNIDLELLKEKDVAISRELNLAINDLDGDGQKEIVTVSYGGEIVALDNQLEEEWRISSLGYPRQLVVVNFSMCMNDLLILADRLYLYSFQGRSSKPCMLPSVTEEILREEIELLVYLGDKYSSEGYYWRAIDKYDLAILKLQQVGDTKRILEISRLRANASKLGEEMLLDAYNYEDEGDLKMSLEEYEEAMKDYEQALVRYQKLDMHEQIMNVHEKMKLAAERIEDEIKLAQKINEERRSRMLALVLWIFFFVIFVTLAIEVFVRKKRALEFMNISAGLLVLLLIGLVSMTIISGITQYMIFASILLSFLTVAIAYLVKRSEKNEERETT